MRLNQLCNLIFSTVSTSHSIRSVPFHVLILFPALHDRRAVPAWSQNYLADSFIRLKTINLWIIYHSLNGEWKGQKRFNITVATNFLSKFPGNYIVSGFLFHLRFSTNIIILTSYFLFWYHIKCSFIRHYYEAFKLPNFQILRFLAFKRTFKPSNLVLIIETSNLRFYYSKPKNII